MTVVLTHTEENYLKAIYKANQSTKEAVSTNMIAQEMNTSPASVTDMMKKLANKELIIYEKYRGARLSSTGSKTATSLVRKHRLWETFLVQKLGFSWEEVHEIAEELEHINSDKLIDKLDQYLDYPKYDPHGDPIPNAEGKFTLREQIAINRLLPDDNCILVGVKNHDGDFLTHLNKCSIGLGTELLIKEKSSYDQSMRVLVDKKEEILLSQKVCNNLLVRKVTSS